MTKKPKSLLSKSNNMMEIYESLQERARTYDDVQKVRIALSHRRDQKGYLPVGYNAPENLKTVEVEIKKDMKRLLKGVPLWEEFLKNISGVGEGLGAAIIGELHCKRILNQRCKQCANKENPKSFCKECEWKTILRSAEDFPSTSHFYSYCGFGNNPDGTIHKRQKGKPANWNNFLKQTLWKFAQNQIKQGKTYRNLYDKRKKYESRLHLSKSNDPMNKKSMGRLSKSSRIPDKKSTPDLSKSRMRDDKKSTSNMSKSNVRLTKKHIHNRCCRYIIKRFLADLYHEWKGDFKGRRPQ